MILNSWWENFDYYGSPIINLVDICLKKYYKLNQTKLTTSENKMEEKWNSKDNGTWLINNLEYVYVI